MANFGLADLAADFARRVLPLAAAMLNDRLLDNKGRRPLFAGQKFFKHRFDFDLIGHAGYLIEDIAAFEKQQRRY